MTDEPWAVVSLRIDAKDLPAQEIERLLGAASSSGSDEFWSADLTTDRSATLDDQLRVAKQWLRERAAALRALVDADVCVHIGWTPRDPQDGIIMDRELVDLLHDVRGYVLLDTYRD